MKKSCRLFWVCLITSLLLIPQGILLRMSNERTNKAVVFAADYYDFEKAAATSGLRLHQTLEKLQENGVKVLAIREKPGTSAEAPYFDRVLLQDLSKMGFEILLRPAGKAQSSSEYFSHLDTLIKEYQVKRLIFDGMEVPGFPDHLDTITQVIINNEMTVGIIEPRSQVRYIKQAGLEKLIPESGYRVNRVYITPPEDLAALDAAGLTHRWLRGIVDRNIRIVYLNPVADTTRMLEAVSGLNKVIGSMGYETGSPIPKLSTAAPSQVHYLLSSISLLFAALLLGCFLTNHTKFFTPVSLSICMTILFFDLLYLFFHIELPLFLALLAAVIYPSLAGLALIRFAAHSEKEPWAIRILISLAVLLGLSLAGAYTIVTTLSDIRYTLNMESFNTVYEAYMFPLILFTIGYLTVNSGMKLDRRTLWSFMKQIATFKGLISALVITLILYIYLSRSGNYSLIPASAAELHLRNLLEDIFYIRPRFKEFLIGYPCLFIFVTLTNQVKNKVTLLPAGIGAVIGSISIINSFCHGFTAVTVSTQRTAYGLLLGLITGFISISLLFICQHIRKKREP